MDAPRPGGVRKKARQTNESRALAALALIVFGLGAGLAWAEESFTVAQLMSERQQVKSSSASFREIRTLAALDQPLEATGLLRFVAPDHLERHTLAPHEEHLVVDGDKVTIDQGKGRPRSFSLESSPEMSALIESIRGALAGDETSLARHYEIQIEGSDESWELLLTPKLPKVKAYIESIRIGGGDGTIRTVETVDHSGDRSVMTVTETGP